MILRDIALALKKKYPLLIEKTEPLHNLYFQITETIIRFNKNDTVIISEKNKEAKIFLPHKGDAIQRAIVVNNTFYELDILKSVEKYVDRSSVIIDIGSNIGNHVIYFGKILEVSKIYAFEPQRNIFNVLKKNVELNELTAKVEIFNFALGSKTCRAAIDHDGSLSNNLGSTSVKEDDAGNIEMKKLDDIKMTEEKINFIKIDVEGFEVEVLKGASITIQKYKPIIWVESFGENYVKIKEFLTGKGYLLKEEFPNFNYLFMPKNSVQ